MNIATIGIIGAMNEEVNQLIDSMQIEKKDEIAGMTFYVGALGKVKAVVVKSGIGKVNAAACTQILCDKYSVDYIINTGIAGSLDSRIDIGDIVISSDAIEHDMNVKAFGYKRGVVPQMSSSIYLADKDLVELAFNTCIKTNTDINAYIGRVASGDLFVSDKKTKDGIKSEFDALCTEMEGAAIAHVASINCVPFVIIRAISDKADGTASEDYSVFEQRAAEHCSRLVMALAEAVGVDLK